MSIKELQQLYVEFRDQRDWKQFHNPKDLTLGLMLEAGELLEHFQRKTEQQQRDHIKNKKDDVGEEIADIFARVLLIAHDFDIDLADAYHKKMAKNDAKYPIDKAKGSAKKYNQL